MFRLTQKIPASAGPAGLTIVTVVLTTIVAVS